MSKRGDFVAVLALIVMLSLYFSPLQHASVIQQSPTTLQVQQNMNSCFDSNAADTGTIGNPYVCNTTPLFTPVTGTVVWFASTAGANAGPFIKVNGGPAQVIIGPDGTNLPNTYFVGTQGNGKAYYALKFDGVTSSWVMGDTNGFAIGGAAFISTNGCIPIFRASLPGQLGCSLATIDPSTGNMQVASINLTGNVTLPFVMAKNTQAATAPTAGHCVMRWEAGTNAGTGKLVGYCGTSSTGVTIIDNVGAGF